MESNDTQAAVPQAAVNTPDNGPNNARFAALHPWRQSENFLSLVLMLLWVGFFAFLWSTIAFEDEQGIHTRSVNLGGDWVVHMTFTNAFHDWPISDWFSKSPLMSEGNFAYPAAPNIFSALIMHTGLSDLNSMKLSSFICCTALLFALYFFFREFKFGRLWSLIGLSLFLLNGGFGYMDFFFDGTEHATHLKERGYVVQNFIISEFIPQRAILFAAPLFLTGLIFVKRALESPIPKHKYAYMAAVGLISNLIMFSSMHSYLCFVIICFITGLFNIKQWKSWSVLVLIAGLTNAALYFGYYAVNNTDGFLKFRPGEFIKFSELSLVEHFVKNYALLLPIAAYGIYRHALWKKPYILAGMFLLTLAYFVQFQPWIWDNTKIITWAVLLLILALLFQLQHWWGQNWRKKIVVFVVLASGMCAGTIDVWRLYKPNARIYTMFTPEDRKLAEQFNALTSHDDIVLNHTGYNSWVYALAGRQVYKGFTGWLWTYGVDTGPLEREQKRMLKGDVEALAEHNIDYIVIDRHHEKKLVDQRKFARYKRVLKSRRYLVLKVEK